LSFAAPAALGFLGFLGIVAVLHMLRVERRRQDVSSTMLWRGLVQDPPASRPWRPLRATVLLALQLAFVAALAFALARPLLPAGERVGSFVIVLVDRSASMGATDVSPNRLREATRQVERLLASTANPQVTLIAFDDEMEVLLSGESDLSVVGRELRGIAVRPVGGRADDAVAFAAALAEGHRDAQVIVASDGGFALEYSGGVQAPVREVRVGVSDGNQGIRAIGLESGPLGEPGDLFVAVVNAAAAPIERRLDVRVDGRLVDARVVALPPRGEVALNIPVPWGAEVVEVALDGDDHLAADDRAWVVSPVAADTRVVLATAGNRFLDTAFRLLPGVAGVLAVAPDSEGPFARADILVRDGLSGVGAEIPASAVLLLGAEALAGAVIEGDVTQPVLRTIRADHVVVAGVRLEDVRVLDMPAVTLGPEWLPLVVASAGGRDWPVIAVGTVGASRAAFVAFDLSQSDLPLRPEFPLLIANLVAFLHPGGLVGVPPSASPWVPVRLRLPATAERMTLIDPTGRRHALSASDAETVFASTGTLGLYTVEVESDGDARTARFAVNLEAEREISVQPQSLPSLRSAAEPAVVVRAGQMEIWRPLAWVALLLLVLEWGWFHRGLLPRRPVREPPRGVPRPGL
jgi:Ca-activated chloride channel homolog